MDWAGKTPTTDEWRDILEKHARWLRAEDGGVRADLSGAYLSGARLSGDDLKPTLVGDRPYLSIGPIGSEHGMLDVYLTDAGVYLRRGCWFGSIDEFEAAVTDKHGSNDHGKEYRAAIEMARAHATIWNPATEGAA